MGYHLNDFYFIVKDDPEEALQVILDLVSERIPKRFRFDRCDDIQVLTPMHKGSVGAVNLNTQLQGLLNPNQQGVTRWGRDFRVGDKVMQIRNNYDKEVFNGDIGRITGIDFEAEEVTISFDGREACPEFVEGWALILPIWTRLSSPMRFQFIRPRAHSTRWSSSPS